jgi:tetratricopeptide (TPR) repeat protein
LKGRVENALGNYRKAHEEYEKALKARPGDAGLLALDGENFLKLPDYDRASGRLEAAAKADPSRLGVARELSRLYAETGQANKVAESVARVETLERQQLEERRKTIDPRLVKRIAVGKAFTGEGLGGFGAGLRDSLAGDLARSPYIQIIDTKNREDTDRERDRLAQGADLSPEELRLDADELAALQRLEGSPNLDFSPTPRPRPRRGERETCAAPPASTSAPARSIRATPRRCSGWSGVSPKSRRRIRSRCRRRRRKGRSTPSAARCSAAR